METYETHRDEALRLLNKAGFHPYESLVIVAASAVNHPIPIGEESVHPFERNKKIFEHLLKQLFDKEISYGEIAPVFERGSRLREYKIIKTTKYLSELKCIYLCDISSKSALATQRKLDDIEFVKLARKCCDWQLSYEETAALIDHLNNLAKSKPKLKGWKGLDSFVSTITRFKKMEGGFISAPLREQPLIQETLRELNAKFAVDDWKPNLVLKTKEILAKAEKEDTICIKSFFARWLVTAKGDLKEIISKKIEEGVKFEIMLNPMPPGSGREEWLENFFKLRKRFEKHEKQLRIFIVPPNMKVGGLEMPLYGTFVRDSSGVAKSGLIFLRVLGTTDWNAMAYTSKRSKDISNAFSQYKSKIKRFFHLMRVSWKNATAIGQALEYVGAAFFLIGLAFRIFLGEGFIFLANVSAFLGTGLLLIFPVSALWHIASFLKNVLIVSHRFFSIFASIYYGLHWKEILCNISID
jgi:hypothetical protein